MLSCDFHVTLLWTTDSDAMKAKALANVESAFRNQNEKLQVYNACVSKDEEQKDLQESC